MKIANIAKVPGAVNEVRDELSDAMKKFPEFNGPHEGYAVILEGLDELWEEVRQENSSQDLGAMRKEACQVAAMAIRFMVELT